MAFIQLPSGKIVDTDHISYMSHRSHALDADGATHRHRVLHMDNNDLIRIDQPDITALDAALTWSSTSATRPS
jgi:hypothetical protein